MVSDALSIEDVSVPSPYSGILLRTGRFPLGAGLRGRLSVFFDRISAAVCSRRDCETEVFLQVEFLGNGREIFDQHASDWNPSVGLGVWPNRPPPDLWKTADMFKMFAEFRHSGKKRPLMYRTLRLTGAQSVRAEALALTAGTGMLMSIWTDSGELFLERTRVEFLPSIKAPNFRIFPFYVPLLDLQSLNAAKPGDLERWLCGLDVYMRESPTDDGIILASTMPLLDLIEEAGARSEVGHNKWFLDINGTN